MSNLQILGVFIYYSNFKLAEAPVGGLVLRLIGEQVLLAQVLLQLRERLVQVARVFREDGAPAGRVGEFFEHAFSDAAPALIADADRIDHHLGAQSFVDRFVQLHTAGGVFTVGEKNDRLAARLFGQHVGGGGDDRIVERSPALPRLAVDRRSRAAVYADRRRRNECDLLESFADALRIRGQLLHDGRFAGADDRFDETPAGVLQLRQHELLAAADVDQDRHRQRQIEFALEGEDVLWLAVFEDLNVLLFQIVDVVVLFVLHAEEQVDELGAELDRRLFLLRLLRLLRLLFLLFLLLGFFLILLIVLLGIGAQSRRERV